MSWTISLEDAERKERQEKKNKTVTLRAKGVDDDKTLTLEIAVLGRQTLFGFARAEYTPAGAK
jgi:hypothetical protein